MKTVRTTLKVAISAALILLVTGFAIADPDDDGPFSRSYDGQFERGYGGMMGGRGGGMMGGRGPGMMGGGYAYGNATSGCGGTGSFYGFNGGERISMEDVESSIDEFLRYNRLGDLEVSEVMEFERNFYAQLVESDTEIGALEVLIDPYTGYVSAEPGPNMMWNTKYGHMQGWQDWGRRDDRSMRIEAADAVERAQAYLDYYETELTADDHPDRFYGYYTLHVMDGHDIVGMLSVNGFDGNVWYHNWHGDFLGMEHHD